MRLELKRRDNAKVAATATDSPEEICVLLRRRTQYLAVGGNHFGRQQVIHGEPVLAGEPAHPATQSQAADPSVADDTCWHREPISLRRRIHVPQ